MLRDFQNTDWKGKKVLISGAGNVAQYAALKVIELGGTVISLSDSTGALINESGFSPKDIEDIATIKLERKALTQFTGSSVKYHEGKRPWTLVKAADVALPCATQNEVSEEEAKYLVKIGVKYVAEGSNMSVAEFPFVLIGLKTELLGAARKKPSKSSKHREKQSLPRIR